MTDRPILFSGPMVRAVLEGRKMQTRQIAKPIKGVTCDDLEWEDCPDGLGRMGYIRREHVAMPYAVGDRLWVRETWGYDWFDDGNTRAWKNVVYRADDGARPLDQGDPAPWRPSIHMPRWASRITLLVTDVRAQRVQDISEDDAKAEGVTPVTDPNELKWQHYVPHAIAFHELWDSINAKRGFGWDVNPWVVAVTFEPVMQNIDQLETQS